MVFTENQVTQFYVVTEKDATLKKTGGFNVLGKNGVASVQVKGADTILRTDIIKKENLLWAKATNAEADRRPLKELTLKLRDDVNGGKPIAGQDYTMNIFFQQYLGISDEHVHVKTAAVHANAGMEAPEFYQRLAVSLYMNFLKELTPLVEIYVGGKVITSVKTDAATGRKVPYNGNDLLTGTADGIKVREVAQPWTLGLQEQVPVFFELHPTTVYLDGDEVSWGKVENTTPKKDNTGAWTPTLDINPANTTTYNAIGNGCKIADMEYFYMGERGDQYRLIGWPNYVATKYLVKPFKADGTPAEYHTLNLHFAYVGANEGVQKSEKDMLFVCDDKDKLNNLIQDLNTALGTTIAEL